MPQLYFCIIKVSLN